MRIFLKIYFLFWTLLASFLSITSIFSKNWIAFFFFIFVTGSSFLFYYAQGDWRANAETTE